MPIRVTNRTATEALNVRDFGALGNGTTNDQPAIDAAVSAMGNGSLLFFPPGSYLYQKTANAGNDQAAIKLDGLSDVAVVFDQGAELVMDTLTGGGTSGTRHGVLVLGAAENVWLENITVRWDPVPSARTLGDGIRVLGYPSDSAPAGGWTATTGTVKNIHILNCTSISCPQTGCIVMGATDVRVDNYRVDGSKADGLHFNACRRVKANGHTAANTGDDGLALVTYYHATDVWTASDGPFYQPGMTNWCNGGSTFSGITSTGSTANGIRIAQAYNLTINGVAVENATSSGIIIDAGEADGINYNWTYAASRGVVIDGVSVVDCDTGVLAEVFNSGTADNSRYWKYDVRLGNIVARDCANRGIRFQGDGSSTAVISGVSITGYRGFNSNAASFAAVRDCAISDIYNEGAIQVYGEEVVFTGALSGMARHNVTLNGLLANGGQVLLQDLRGVQIGTVKSTDSTSDGVILTRVKEAQVSAVSVVRANRGNTGTVRALLITTCQQLTVGVIDIEHDSNTSTSWRSLEIGGGDATNISEHLLLEKITYRNTINQVDSDVVLQGGSFAPKNYVYDMRFYNGGEASPIYKRERLGYTSWPEEFYGTGSPNTVIFAPVGSTFLRTDGGTTTTLYVKETNTWTSASGWVAK